MEKQLDPLQLDATSGDGRILTVPDPERIVQFLIRSKGQPTGGQPTGGEIQIECCPMQGPATGGAQMVWRPDGGAISVPALGDAAIHYAGKVSGVFRARISTPVTGGTVTVWPLVGVLIGNTNKVLEPVVR